MERDTDRFKSFSRRAAVLGGVKLALFGTLAGRLYYLQIMHNDRYEMLADDNRINMRLIAPSRGPILDRQGIPIAVNDQAFRVLLVPEQSPNIDRTLDALRTIIPIDDDERRRIVREIKRGRPFLPVEVKDNLDWAAVAGIEVNAPDLPGVSIDMGEVRTYPHGQATAHLVGYVGAVSRSDLTGDPVLALPGFKIGKGGVEGFHDERLRGKAGTSHVEVNAYGRIIRELTRDDGRPGAEVRLTLDVELQDFVQSRLAHEKSASAIVMDVNDGALYAMASTPSFDPNLFAKGIPADVWEELLANPTNPLTNKATSGQYPPGSTFKMVVALAALESGIIGPGHEVYCPGHMELGNHRFHCWKRGGHGKMDLIQAIGQSCDVWFYDVAKRVGIDRIAQMAHKFGFGTRLGVDLPTEKPGLVPSKEWKLGRFDEPWQQGESLIAAIGQGYMLATPLQLATMTARLANGGRAVVPRLTHRVGDDRADAVVPADMGLNKANLQWVLDGMIEVMEGKRGTARKAQISEDGMHMAGKTGTAQVRRITLAERRAGIRKNSDLPWRHRDHALFVAYAPIEAPRFACSVVVEHAGGGSTVAAPIARDILLEVQKRHPPASLQVSSTLPRRKPRPEDI